ncbi:Uma2 family endonuclease [Streptomyces alfalfae]|uniref:Uma2 family endonuclease n=2 Tax=Streptomyces alfalfae TaxID=1642299 RepID=A0A7T4PGR6_9ACTN|nr:Uma2 family endonuclease [Streptomyces alfalfae]QQC89967.1 Uma2 family endonuclease [Streptomyces alfalfae]QUI32350.1 Uma2 family endonuclease [Streptomyces alfalfae]
MTVVDVMTDRIEMADDDAEWSLDDWFELIERMVPEGVKAEVVEGAVVMVPQRNVHWQIIRRVLYALDDRYSRDVHAMTDVRIDFPGHQNGFCPDMAKLRDGAKPNEEGRWRHEDVEFVAEVISRGTGLNDYGPKKAAYAEAGVPVYLVVDPYQGRCHVFTDPKEGEYRTESRTDFGEDVDMTGTAIDLVLKTDTFPRG